MNSELIVTHLWRFKKLIKKLILECTTHRDCRHNPRGFSCDRNGRCCNAIHNRVCINGGGGRGMKSKNMVEIKGICGIYFFLFFWVAQA